MKRLGRILCRLLKALVLLTVVAVIAVDAFFEVVGAPPQVVRRWERLMADRGWPVAIGRLRVGFIRGIVADDLVVYLDDERQTRLGSAVTLHVRADLRDLLRQDIAVRSVFVNDASILVPRSDAEGGKDGALLAVRRISGTFGVDDGQITLNRVEGIVRGVQVQLEGTLALDAAAKRPSQQARSGAGGGKRDRLASIVNDLVSRHQDGIERFQRLMDQAHFAEEDAFLVAHVTGSLGASLSVTADGRVRVSDAVVRGLGVRQLLASFRYGKGELKLTECKLVLSQDEILDADVSIHLLRRELAGSIKGSLTPASLRCVCPASVRDAIAGLELEDPVSFEAVLARSGYDPRDWAVEGAFRLHSFRYRDNHFSSLSSKVSYGEGRLALSAVDVRGGINGSEAVNGDLSIWLPEKELAADLRGRTALIPRLLRLGGARKRIQGSSATWDLVVQRSPFEWRQWRGSGTIGLSSLRVGDWQGRDLSGELAIEQGIIKATGLKMQGGGDDGMTVNGTVTVDASRPTEDDRVTVAFSVDAVEDVASVAAGPAAKLSGELAFRPCARQVSGHARGNLYPVRFYGLLREALHLPPVQAVSRINCAGPAPFVSLTLPETSWESDDWRLEGELSAQEIQYDTLDVVQASSKLALSRRRVTFSDIAFTERKGAKGTVNVAVDFNPVRVTISGRMKGDPRFIEVFIGAEKGKEIYRSIWKRVSWLPGGEPTIVLDHLITGDGPQRGDWWLQMAGNLAAENATYRGLGLERVGLDVNLDLPRRVSVENIVVTHKGKEIKGDVHIRFGGLEAYEFGVAGICEPKEIVRAINPRWESFLEDFTFVPESDVECHGAFFRGKEPLLHLKGAIRAPSAKYRGFAFGKLSADWEVNESAIGWHVAKGELYGGNVSVRGFFDTSSGTGLMALDASDVRLADLTKQLGASQETKRKVEGKLGGSCQVQFLRSWGAQPLQMTGSGRVVLSEGNLWNVPFLYQLGQVLDLTLISRLSGGKASGLGRISMLEADLDFRGRKLVIPKLYTDGTLFSLAGRGEYRWPTKELDFTVKGETLKKVGVLRLALKPLSWVFDAELNGTVDEHKWTLKTPLQRAFSGKDEPILDVRE